MRQYLNLMFVAALFVTSCAKEELAEECFKSPSIVATQENNPNTKTLLSVDEGVGTIYWQPAEDINVFFGTTSVKYTSTNTENVTTAAFETSTIIGSSEGSSTNIWGLYPYSSEAVCNGSKVTTTIPSTQYGVPETFDKNLFTTLAHSTTKELQFLNVCGGIKFSLSRADITKITFEGNNGETLAGKVDLTFVDDVPAATSVTAETKITLTPKTGSTFAKDVNYYIITLPVSMTSGFTMTFETATQIGTFNYTTKAVTVSRSKFSKKENIDTYANFVDKPTSATDLSALGTANCYIVSTGGTYKFKTVQGNSTRSVGDIKGVKVLWETFGTNVAPSAGDLIKANISYSDNYITFSTNDTYKKGNALIAAYTDADCTDGNVLWSWHIWLTDVPAEQVYNNSAGTMMDRNIGALSTTPGNISSHGFYYQWGRKDPLIGVDGYSFPIRITPNNAFSSTNTSSTKGTIEYATKHPSTYIGNDEGNDWIYYGSGEEPDITLWKKSNSNKSVFDPCPVGWRVPDGGNEGVWATAFAKISSWTNSSNFDSVNRGMDFGSTDTKLCTGIVWYPASGYYDEEDVEIYDRRSAGEYWSAATTTNGAYSFGFRYNGTIAPVQTNIRAQGLSVRCVKDETYTPVSVTDLSKDGSANCYIVSGCGTYKFKAVRGRSSTTVGDVKGVKVLWETFGTNVTPSVGDLIKGDISYSDNYITFQTNDTYKEGNALIAAYSDANCTDGNVLWSWHIWLTDQPEEQVYNNNAGIMMDRNLGATSATPGDVHALGLLYQWGRKDPFLSGKSILSNDLPAESTLSWPTPVETNAQNGTIEYAISHPTTYIKHKYPVYDWLYNSDASLWNYNYTLYDPCPNGWRVPSGGNSGIWAIALGNNAYVLDKNNTYRGVNFGKSSLTYYQLGSAANIWYPWSGYINDNLLWIGYTGLYWSRRTSTEDSYCLEIDYGSSSPANSERHRYYANSVRCQKIESK